jgi:dTDP-4-dehydrorhamnose reductase
MAGAFHQQKEKKVKQTVAVTGATGKVGLHVVRHLLRAGYHVHVLARARPVAEHPLWRENFSLTILDLATLPAGSIEQWLGAVRPCAVLHLAALADVGACELQPSQAYLLNVSTTQTLARACAAYNVHFILLSTDYVFDGTLDPGLLYTEYHAVNALNTYGKSKVWAERIVQAECAQKTLWTICRTSMVYGSCPVQRPDFVRWVRTCLQERLALQVAQDQINSPTAGIDLARMLVAVVEQRLQGVYHLAGRTSLSRYDFALSTARHYGLDESLIRPVVTSRLEDSPRRPLNVGLCVDKITAATGIAPMSLEEGLALTWLDDPARTGILSNANPSRRWSAHASREIQPVGL